MLCTATLGPPREGRRTADPLADAASGRVPAAADREGDEDGPDEAPVGSLRFLRGQVALESDMNSRRVRAGVEMTGDSGSLAEARRLHLQVSAGAGVKRKTWNAPLYVFLFSSRDDAGLTPSSPQSTTSRATRPARRAGRGAAVP